MKNKQGRTPVYLTVASDLRSRIVSGALTPGSILPSENDLCAEYAASRETIRKGLNELTQEGLIYSLPRRGYFVSPPQREEFTLSVPKVLRDCECRFKDIRIICPEPEIQEILQISSEQRVIALFSRYYQGETLFGVQTKYLPYDKG